MRKRQWQRLTIYHKAYALEIPLLSGENWRQGRYALPEAAYHALMSNCRVLHIEINFGRMASSILSSISIITKAA